MGVRIGDATWSYTGFHNFRTEVARLDGIDLNEMAGFCDREDAVRWDSVDSALNPLLDHSDCDGVLTPEQCAQVAPRLAELSDQLHSSYDRRQAENLVEAMELCIASGVPLEFR